MNQAIRLILAYQNYVEISALEDLQEVGAGLLHLVGNIDKVIFLVWVGLLWLLCLISNVVLQLG